MSFACMICVPKQWACREVLNIVVGLHERLAGHEFGKWGWLALSLHGVGWRARKREAFSCRVFLMIKAWSFSFLFHICAWNIKAWSFPSLFYILHVKALHGVLLYRELAQRVSLCMVSCFAKSWHSECVFAWRWKCLILPLSCMASLHGLICILPRAWSFS